MSQLGERWYSGVPPRDLAGVVPHLADRHPRLERVLELMAARIEEMDEGTWTPTLTGVANVTALTARVAQWKRSGLVVDASGELDCDPTAASTLTQIGISLPMPSNFASSFQCAGGATMDPGSVAMVAGRIYGDATNNRAQLDYYCDAGAANRTVSYWFQYLIAA